MRDSTHGMFHGELDSLLESVVCAAAKAVTRSVQRPLPSGDHQYGVRL
jgi:hypothetical protein